MILHRATFLFMLLSMIVGVRVTNAAADPIFANAETGLITGFVRVVCYDQADQPPTADVVLKVMDGVVVGDEPFPTTCNYITALQERHNQLNAHGEVAYTVYATNLLPGNSSPEPVGDTVKIYNEQRLTLFNIVASLAWKPTTASAEITTAQVETALARAAVDLYDWSEGQLSIGEITVYEDGINWDTADLRFLPANDRRPSAYVGGIVNATTAYAPVNDDYIYTPANAFFGRLWDGKDAQRGDWEAPAGIKTILHEWAHYALFLYDEYQDISGSDRYCICKDLPAVGTREAVCNGADPALTGSVMAFHYTASEFWHPTGQLDWIDQEACEATWQYMVHQQSDWETLAQWHNIQDVALNPPPIVMNNSLFGDVPLGLASELVHINQPTPPSTAPTEPKVEAISAENDLLGPIASQLYLLESGSEKPTRITHQGQFLFDPFISRGDGVIADLPLLGVESGDRIRVHADQYKTSGRVAKQLAFPITAADAQPTDVLDVDLEADSWAYTLEAFYQIDNYLPTTLTVRLESPNHLLTSAPIAQFCAMDVALGCVDQWGVTMQKSDGWWQVDILPLPNESALPRYGTLRITAPSAPGFGEIVRWVQLQGGVGPAHIDGMAPLVDGEVAVAAPNFVGQPCTAVSVMPAASSKAIMSAIPVEGVVGMPFDVTILDDCDPSLPGENKQFAPLILTLSYGQAVLDAYGISESDLSIYHFEKSASLSNWELMTELGQDVSLNWISAEIDQDGIYAITFGTSIPPTSVTLNAVNQPAQVPSVLLHVLGMVFGLTVCSVWFRRGA